MSAFLHPDESDLSDVTESEDEGPSAKREPPPKPPKVKRVPFTPFLKQPRAHNCTIKTLFEYMNNGTIDLNPVYQRDVVWENEQQSYLIDSLLNNYQIGNIVWGKSDNGERYIMTCIDGKQRLTSILRFMRGEIPSINPNTKDEIWYPAPHLLEKGHPSGKTIKVMNQMAMHEWDSLTVCCAEYEKLEDKMEREIFRRVQMGVPLTGQECMQALSTWRANLVLAFKKTFFHDETGFSPTCPDIWDTKRGIDFSALAAIVYMIDRHTKGITDSMNFVPSFTNLQSWLGDNSQVTEIPESSASRIFIALHVYLKLATSEEHKDCFKLPEVRKAAASSATAAKYTFGMKEFGSIGYFIWRWMDEMSLTQLADAVKRVRKQIGGIRTQFYAKLNQKSWIKGIGKESPSASQEIKATLPPFSLKAFLSINGDRPLASEPTTQSSAPPPTPTPALPTARKRKIDQVDTPVTATPAAPKTRGRAKSTIATTSKLPDIAPSDTVTPSHAPPKVRQASLPSKRKTYIKSDDEDESDTDTPIADSYVPKRKRTTSGASKVAKTTQSASSPATKKPATRSNTKAPPVARAKKPIIKEEATSSMSTQTAIPSSGTGLKLSSMRIPKHSDVPTSSPLTASPSPRLPHSPYPAAQPTNVATPVLHTPPLNAHFPSHINGALALEQHQPHTSQNLQPSISSNALRDGSSRSPLPTLPAIITAAIPARSASRAGSSRSSTPSGAYPPNLQNFASASNIAASIGGGPVSYRNSNSPGTGESGRLEGLRAAKARAREGPIQACHSAPTMSPSVDARDRFTPDIPTSASFSIRHSEVTVDPRRRPNKPPVDTPPPPPPSANAPSNTFTESNLRTDMTSHPGHPPACQSPSNVSSPATSICTLDQMNTTMDKVASRSYFSPNNDPAPRQQHYQQHQHPPQNPHPIPQRPPPPQAYPRVYDSYRPGSPTYDPRPRAPPGDPPRRPRFRDGRHERQ